MRRWLFTAYGTCPSTMAGSDAGAAAGAGPYASMRSTTVAIPCPTPMHIVARP